MNKSDNSTRIIGIDIAKIIAMMFVVAVHIDGFGLPYIDANQAPSWLYSLSRSSLNVVFMSCINIFAIASGFVCITVEFKIKRMMSLWIRTALTGILVLVGIVLATDITPSSSQWVRASFPIAFGQYWYMTAYFMVLVCMPLLNSGIKAMCRVQLARFLCLVLTIVCAETLFISASPLGVASGYSFEWLLLLYVIGAYIRLYNPIKTSSWRLAAIGVSLAIVASGLSLVLARYVCNGWLCKYHVANLSSYTSPFVLAIAICIFMVCVRINICNKVLAEAIQMISAASLGVYLIHTQPVLFKTLFVPYVQSIVVSSLDYYLLILFSLTVGIFFSCILLEMLRNMLFCGVQRVYNGISMLCKAH